MKALISLTLLLPTAVLAEEISPVRLDPGAVSTARSEYNFQPVGDHSRVFARADADFSRGRILFMHRRGGEWSGPEELLFSDDRYKDSDPWLSADGHTLYFISDRPVYAGEEREPENYDIWRARRRGDVWIAPEWLGTASSEAAEFGPEVHGDHLYFSSTRMGRYEIYRAALQHGGIDTPERLPAPINSEADDSDFTLSADGRVAVWCSNRPGGRGRCDLYVSRRTENGWTAAENLGPAVNSAASEFSPSLSANGARLYFASSRPVDGQEDGAADIYQIPVADVPALRSAMAAAVLERLRAAFGGASALAEVSGVSFTLETRSETGEPQRAGFIYDFPRRAIARHNVAAGTTVFVRGERAVRVGTDGETPVDASERIALQSGLALNFLGLLRRDDAELSGPIDIAGYGDLQWYRLSAGGNSSPLLGLDPRSGRIAMLRISDQASVLETDYLRTADGLVWPHRFIVRGATGVREGRFSDVRINPPIPAEAPQWWIR